MGKKAKCSNPECPNHETRVAVYAHGLCWDCHKQQLAGSNAGQEEVAATSTDVEASEAVSGQVLFADTGNMLSDLPEDLDRPFEVAGIRFVPVPGKSSATRSPLVTIRNSAIIAFSAAASERYGLRAYSHARLVPSEDGMILGVKFLHAERPGVHLVQKKEHTGIVLSARAFLRNMPGITGMKTVLEPTEWDGFFVARFGGEAA